MAQVHKRFGDEQVRILFLGYCQGLLTRAAVQEILAISKSSFFALLRAYRQDPAGFSVAYHRATPSRLSAAIEAEVVKALRQDKELVEDKRLPISGYNYSAVRDRLAKKGVAVSLTTIIDRAKRLNCYRARAKPTVHDREVLTAAVGALIQHDGSTHQWAPLAQQKWVLITSIDDFSRMLLFADFFPDESTWAHIQATRTLIQTYGVPLRYYVDSLRVFRFVQGRDSFWRKHVLQTDEVDTQWSKIMRLLGVQVIHALSPQAKGKIERPYRWLQDRIVRTCAMDRISTIDEARSVLRDELDRYNNRQVHSTTREIPSHRFEQAREQGKNLFRPFAPPKPYNTVEDVFCLRETRRVNAYRRISLFKHDIQVPNVPLYEDVEVHLIPGVARQTMDIHVWWDDHLVHSVTYPLQEFHVQL